ncbi:MAG: hypothetical protein IKT91_05830, partial [Clostridia bacterium]|nr:hypothetical protein [Clostridia bacterium]
VELYPDDISSEQEIGATNIKITSADQYYDYLESELDFWNKVDPNKKLDNIVRYNRLQNAKSSFETALRYIQSPTSMVNYLNQSVQAIAQGVLSSNTNLSRELLKHVGESSSFLTGFRMGMLIKKDLSFSTTAETFRGFYVAMAYRGVFNSYAVSAAEKIAEFKTNVEEAAKQYSNLNENYTKAFLEQEKRLESITMQTNDHLTELDAKSAKQFSDADSRLVNLEKTYREKLRLEAPAEYWAKLKTSYSRKGYVWFGVSGLFAIAIIALLLVVLIKDIIIFSPDANWIENLKNSAIITVIASIGIFILRLTTKMALSSHHLASDARERENLSLFYLSLIEKGAVTDKERALVLNALFSRSDTGLLKGESSPSMPSNISDIMDVIKSAKQ